MTDETSDPADTDAEPTVVSVLELSPMMYLQVALRVVYKHEGNAVPLTLSVGGSMITGIAVHPVAWLRAMAEQAGALPRDSASPPEGQIRSSDMFRELFEQLANERSGTEPPALDQIGFIYLVNAAVVSGSSPLMFNDLACWQVPLSSVDAWTIGFPHRRE